MLLNASVASMIYSFNMDNIKILQEAGCEIVVACNMTSDQNQERIRQFRTQLESLGIHQIDIPCPRKITKIGDIISTYKILKKMADTDEFDLVHTQSPIGSVICRLAFRNERRRGTKVLYLCHGFHFYKGAPLANWLVFYPIEKTCARLCDCIGTINKEDEEICRRNFHCANVFRLPGVGIDIRRFGHFSQDEIVRIRARYGLHEGDGKKLILSVGELNENKNHELVIKAIKGREDIVYCIAGRGNYISHIKSTIEKLGIGNRVHLLGYRSDIPLLDQAADLFAFPSIREGLGLSAIEALASGTPVIGMNTRGINEYVQDGVTGFLFENNVRSCRRAVDAFFGLSEIEKEQMAKAAIAKSKEYDWGYAHSQMTRVYDHLLGFHK